MLDSIFELKTGTLWDIGDAIKKKRRLNVFGACENARYHISALCGKRFLYVVSDLVSARDAVDRIREYGDGAVELMREREDVLIARKATDYATLFNRLSLLERFSKGEISLVATTETLLQRFPEKRRLLENILTLRVGQTVDPVYLRNQLVFAGYTAQSLEDQASFRLHGDTMDIWTLGSENPVRIGFFDNEIESIRLLSKETLMSEKVLEEVKIFPATDILITEEEAKKIILDTQRAKKTATHEACKQADEEIERFSVNPSSSLNTYFLPFMTDYTTTLYSYLPQDGIIIFDDTRQTEDKLKLLRNAFVARVEEMKENRLLPRHADSIWSLETVKNFTAPVIGFDRITGRPGMFTPQEMVTVRSLALPKFFYDMEGFFTQIQQHLLSGIKTRIYTASEESRELLKKEFADHNIGVQENAPEALLSILVEKVSYGFSYPADKLMCVGMNDLSRRAKVTVPNERRKRVVFEMPQVGDYVVHEKYGIGISEGVQRLKTSMGERDYFVILYKGGDKLYLPGEQLDAVEKYTGQDKPVLHRLGSGDFEKVKERIRASVRAMAFDLLKLYRDRFNKKGYVYQPDTVWQKEFEDDFEYTETEDQLRAINEIKSDMESGKIMDRLLCGDVGYGKTEVAIRAIFKTIIEGKQAAFLAPTTILAQQHYNLLCSRFNKYKIKVELLSRFVAPADQKKALERLKKGEASVVVATHRLLSSDIIFHDLGLLVLDEEQRFGVEQKEKLKLFRNQINILTLSATPIPRTLHMALSGIRDISLLETPPKERLPVQTYVTEYNDGLLKDAVQKEIARGGQVFILYNSVKGIENFYDHVCDLFIGQAVSITFAHGQMEETLLEDRIKLFYEGKADVLISTTIIENGVDLPNANTIFVLDSDRLGLSQMYQLRGRVGRRNILAYAYFTVPEGKVLTTDAIKRLEAIMDNTALGSGFGIAMRDLEIRGAGNVLGREQHGQMEKVGYEMYLRLVQEGIEEMQGKEIKAGREVTMQVEGNYILDENFFPDAKAKIAFYKTVATLASDEEGRAYYRHIKEAYGTPPEGTEGILKIAILKNMGQKADVELIRIDSKHCEMHFVNGKCLTQEKLFEAMDKYKNFALLTPNEKPVVSFRCGKFTIPQRINVILKFLQFLQ